MMRRRPASRQGGAPGRRDHPNTAQDGNAVASPIWRRGHAALSLAKANAAIAAAEKRPLARPLRAETVENPPQH
jgi:hypothetical protein